MKNYANLSICKELNVINENYNTQISIVEGLGFSQKDLIRVIEFYSNSKYLNGNTDELGREKPFYNIINSMCDVENAAKDIDTKDIQATSDDGNHYMESFLLTKDIYQWMKVANFAKILNEMRDAHTRYGSLLVKKVIKVDDDGNRNLSIEIPEWKNLITDQIDIKNGPIIECHWMSLPDILKMKAWNKATVDELVGKCVKSGYNSRIPIYEVRGNFPKAFIKEVADKKPTKEDETDFSYQLYYFGSMPVKANEKTPKEELFSAKLIPLYWENDTDKCYKYTARKKKAGRAFGVGVSEEGEEAQVWTNDVVLKQFRAMEYTTKVIGQSASKRLKGRNLLNEVDDGQILEHEDNKPITALQLLPAGGLSQYQTLITQWFTQFERATSAYAAQRGESPSSRTAAKLQAAVLQQSGSVMKDIKEDLGIFITEIFEDWIMPFLGKRLNKEHILAHDFSLAELKEIDRNFAVNTANRITKERILSGRVVTSEDFDKLVQEADEMIKRTKASRFLEIPKDYYKKAKPKITINVTGEQSDKEAVSGVLLNIMKIYIGNPQLISDPVLTQIFMKIVEISGAGISPVQLIGAIQERAAQLAKEDKGSSKISSSINFKDLPPEGKVQMADQAGIKINPPPAEQQPGAVPEAVPQ